MSKSLLTKIASEDPKPPTGPLMKELAGQFFVLLGLLLLFVFFFLLLSLPSLRCVSFRLLFVLSSLNQSLPFPFPSFFLLPLLFQIKPKSMSTNVTKFAKD
jgi:hypothetical protein